MTIKEEKGRIKLFCAHTQRYLGVIKCLQEIQNATSTPIDCFQCLKGEITDIEKVFKPNKRETSLESSTLSAF